MEEEFIDIEFKKLEDLIGKLKKSSIEFNADNISKATKWMIETIAANHIEKINHGIEKILSHIEPEIISDNSLKSIQTLKHFSYQYSYIITDIDDIIQKAIDIVPIIKDEIDQLDHSNGLNL